MSTKALQRELPHCEVEVNVCIATIQDKAFESLNPRIGFHVHSTR